MSDRAKEYIVICFNEDGDPPDIEALSRETLVKRLNEEYYGDPAIARTVPADTSSFVGLLIIKGEVVVPSVLSAK